MHLVCTLLIDLREDITTVWAPLFRDPWAWACERPKVHRARNSDSLRFKSKTIFRGPNVASVGRPQGAAKATKTREKMFSSYFCVMFSVLALQVESCEDMMQAIAALKLN